MAGCTGLGALLFCRHMTYSFVLEVLSKKGVGAKLRSRSWTGSPSELCPEVMKMRNECSHEVVKAVCLLV